MANPNPSPETRFKPGSTPNPGGMTKEVRERNAKTADLASQLREAALSSAMEKLAAGADPLELLNPDLIRVLKDSEDRAHGTPKQAIAHGSDPDNPLPAAIAVHFVKPDEQA
jgi:hypothetical protein